MLIPLQKLSAQRELFGIVRGHISETETGSPIPNAIVYFVNTLFGVSTSADGEFTIYAPPGNYDMVISCVGYERQSIPLQLMKSDSLYFDIKLLPRPIQSKEVVITAEPLDTMALRSLNQIRFFPKSGPDSYCLFGSVSSVPIGILISDSAFYMYAFEQTIIDSEKYLQLWLLYKNLSQAPYDLDPVKCVQLNMKKKDMLFMDIRPDPSFIIRTRIDTIEAAKKISSTVGTILKNLAVNRSKFDWEGEGWMQLLLILQDLLKMNRTISSFRPKNFYPARDESFSSMLYTTFERSVNIGVWGRYLVYPDNSVNGYIYFPFPGMNWKTAEKIYSGTSDYHYEIELHTPTGKRIIEFTLH